MVLSDKPQYPRLLICEGHDDCEFFKWLIEGRNLPRCHIHHTGIQRRAKGGNSKFGDAISKYRIERPKTYRLLKHIVFVADNDENPEESFSSVQRQIRDKLGNEYVPNLPLATTNSSPKTSIVMLPHADQKGNLEVFCVEAARSADAHVMAAVQSFLDTCRTSKWEHTGFFVSGVSCTMDRRRLQTRPYDGLRRSQCT